MPPRILTKNNKKKMKNFGSLTTHLLNGVHLWSVDVVWSLKSARTIVGDIEREVLEKKKEDDFVWEKKKKLGK